MRKSPLTVLQQLDARLHQQALEVEHLRAALDIQFQQIAYMQGELDVMPASGKRRKSLGALLVQEPSHNRNGRRDR